MIIDVNKREQDLKFWKRNPCFQTLVLLFNMRALLKTTTLEPYRVWTTCIAETGQWKNWLLWNKRCLTKDKMLWENDSELERGTCGHCSPQLPLSFSLCLIIVGNALCIYYMYLSHLVYQIFISNSFKLNIFRASLVKMLWITLKHCGTFIVVWGCWLCAHVSRYTSKGKLYNVYLFALMLFTENY